MPFQLQTGYIVHKRPVLRGYRPRSMEKLFAQNVTLMYAGLAEARHIQPRKIAQRISNYRPHCKKVSAKDGADAFNAVPCSSGRTVAII